MRGRLAESPAAPDRLDDDQAQQLKQILAPCTALDRIAEHVRAFAELMNDRPGAGTPGCQADPGSRSKAQQMVWR